MKKYSCIIALALCISLICCCDCNHSRRSTSLPRADKATTERFAAACDSAFDYMNGFGVNEAHSLMVLQDGKVVYEHYALGHSADELHVLWSASKTFTATAIGFAAQDGLLSVNDKVISFFNDDELPEQRHPYLEQMTVRDLLIMSSGFSNDVLGLFEGSRFFAHDWTKAMLSSEMGFEPGSRFSYNSGNTYLLSEIVGRVTGQRLDTYLTEKLFEPLGIREFQYEISPDGIAAGGWGLYLSLESFAKMGQFMLQKGNWNGRQLLNEEWFDEAMSAQILQYDPETVTEEDLAKIADSESNQGYCYQMWRCTHNAVRLDGAWGQYCTIIPDKNAVVANFNHSGSTERHIKTIWMYIYPLL